MGIEFSNDMDLFRRKIEEEMERQGVESEKQLELPKQNAADHGSMELIKVNGLALTTEGKLTKTSMLESLTADSDQYDDIMLTAEQALSLASTYRKLSTGTNAVVPIKCTGPLCPFKDDCFYHSIGQAPLGKKCKVEYDLLNYHSTRFIEQFDVDPQNHSDFMLVQELSELIVYEMRLARILGGWVDGQANNNKSMYLSGETVVGAADEVHFVETQHWAFDAMEKVKNRRMKILDALMGTPKSRNSKKNDQQQVITSYSQQVGQIVDILRNIKETKYEEAEYEEGEGEK